MPLIENLEMDSIFKDEAKEKGDGVITTRRRVRSS
jgi:hypothetical protein